MPTNRLGQIREELAAGLQLDPYELQNFLFKDGNNVLFTRRGVKKIPGYEQIIQTADAAPIRGLTQLVDTSGDRNIFFGDQGKLYRLQPDQTSEADTVLVKGGFSDTAFAGPAGFASENVFETTSSVEEGTGYSGIIDPVGTTIATTWSLVPFGVWVIATNGVDLPQIYKGVSFADITPTPPFTTAEIMLNRGPHILAFNLSTSKKDFAWSDEDDPELWAAATTNAAGSLQIRELDTEIVAAVPIGDGIAVYGRNQMFIVSYLGAPLYFGYRPAVRGVGAVSKTSVVANGSLNYGLSRQGFWETNGVSFKYIDDAKIRDWAQNNINWEHASKINSFHDVQNTSIVWYVPTATTEPDTHLRYNYQTGEWSKGDIAFTSSADREVFSYPLTASFDGEVNLLGLSNSANGAAISANIQTTALDLGEPDRIKEIQSIRLGYIGNGLRFRVGVSDTPDGTVTWGSYITVSDGYEFHPLYCSGRYLFLDIDTQNVGDVWELQAIDFYGRLGGTR
jgi:hypothetical protein